ncbi:hypothetical protein ACN47E_002860 [Coniothyrium glycines]
MANEEQRRAFASYMGTANTSQGQSVPQYSGAAANSGNPYLYNVQQGGFLPAGFGAGGYGSSSVHQRPPPLGQAETSNGQQVMPALAPTGYGAITCNYSNQPPQLTSPQSNWLRTSEEVELARRRSGAPQGTMVPISRSGPMQVTESRSTEINGHYSYQQYGKSQAPTHPQGLPPQVEEVPVPVMLCHTCSDCGRMRSAGYHRNNPVVPGKPLVSSLCRRCKKKARNHRHRHGHSGSSYTRIRSCTAGEPCDWPRESFQVEIDPRERRGRRRSREDFYPASYSYSRPRIVRQSSSQTRLGLRVLQQPRREYKTETRVRVSSLSPRRSSQYDEIWPRPDIVRLESSKLNSTNSLHRNVSSAQAPQADEVWPPPDIVHTHLYRKVESLSPLRRTSSRIIELSPSPPPTSTRSTRVVYRSRSQERQSRSQSSSPIRVTVRRDRRSDDLGARVVAHTGPSRSIVRDVSPPRRESDEGSYEHETLSRRRTESPSRGVLKYSDTDHETPIRRKSSARNSQQSTHVEVGGPRVRFGQDQRVSEPMPLSGTEGRYARSARCRAEEYEQYHDYSRHRYAEEPISAPLQEDFEGLRIRPEPISAARKRDCEREEDIHIDHARQISPQPLSSQRREEVRVRYTSPMPQASRNNHSPPSPQAPERPPYSGYRHVSSSHLMERARSMTPPQSRRIDKEEDHTDSDSAASDEVTEVRSWRGLGENGKPATFVEERRRMRMIEQGSEHGVEFRPLGDRLGSRVWREV